jgi:ribosomal protein S18 acetylase RimI-like enzyme
VLSIALLPASAVSLQTFVIFLALFYVTDNYYNLALVRGIGGEQSVQLFAGLRWLRTVPAALSHRLPASVSAGFALLGAALETGCSTVVDRPTSIDRVVLVRFIGRRARLDTIAILLLAIVALSLRGPSDVAIATGTAVVAALLVLELFVEPFRGFGVQYENKKEDTDGEDVKEGSQPKDAKIETLLWAVPHRAKLDKHSLATLRSIHEESFAPAERQYTIERMTAAAESNESLMLLTEGTEVVGYLFLEVRRVHEVAYFWYLAIDEAKRAHGHGTSMVRHAIDVVRERWPACRAIFLETAHPSDLDDPASERMRRVVFYQRLGFWWVHGVDYRIPAADAPKDLSRSPRYDPMYFPLKGDGEDLDDAFVRTATIEMARDNFPRRTTDPRWEALNASTIWLPAPPTLRDRTTTWLVRRYARDAAQERHGDVGESETASQCHVDRMDMFRELKRRNGLTALSALLRDPDPLVRTAAAWALLDVLPDSAAAVLRQAGDDAGQVGVDAMLTLRDWEAGRLQYPEPAE